MQAPQVVRSMTSVVWSSGVGGAVHTGDAKRPGSVAQIVDILAFCCLLAHLRSSFSDWAGVLDAGKGGRFIRNRRPPFHSCPPFRAGDFRPRARPDGGRRFPAPGFPPAGRRPGGLRPGVCGWRPKPEGPRPGFSGSCCWLFAEVTGPLPVVQPPGNPDSRAPERPSTRPALEPGRLRTRTPGYLYAWVFMFL